MSYSIYVADDEKNIRELIQSFLEDEGFRVKLFETGDALLCEFEEIPADLVILDVMMPGTDGFSICSSIRKKSDVPIILLGKATLF
ncbi:response regulator [Tissierella praeacuta]|uniref:response regulator n=1 Tax=Tissierella praeacuta TaxID=43131 RepID=UPI0028A5F013|nr:response regulator [Tissierella praeacuta]